jgi:hypothetical protein
VLFFFGLPEFESWNLFFPSPGSFSSPSEHRTQDPARSAPLGQ